MLMFRTASGFVQVVVGLLAGRSCLRLPPPGPDRDAGEGRRGHSRRSRRWRSRWSTRARFRASPSASSSRTRCLLGGFGVREVGKPDKVDADTVFQLASLSKPISATVVAALISDSGGTMSWDSRVADLDPVFRLSQPYPTEQLTLTDLFSHRSGLPGNAGNDLEGLGFDRTDILHRLRLVPPASSFRSGYSYSNFGLTEGGVAAAAGAGMSWEEAAEEKLFRPLGMTSTSARHDEFLTRNNRAALHILVDGAWAPKVKRNPDPQAPAGGASAAMSATSPSGCCSKSTTACIDGRQVISEAALAATHEPVIVRGTNPITGEAGFYAPRLERRLWAARHRCGAMPAPSRNGARTAGEHPAGREARHRRPRRGVPDRRAGGRRRHLLRRW